MLCWRSADDAHLLVVPRSNLCTQGERAIWRAAPRLLNNLPLAMRETDSQNFFKKQPKTPLCKRAFSLYETLLHLLMTFSLSETIIYLCTALIYFYHVLTSYYYNNLFSFSLNLYEHVNILFLNRILEFIYLTSYCAIFYSRYFDKYFRL